MTEGGRLLGWEGCHNARDVGGYPAADGRRVQSGALLRSDNLCRLTAVGRQQLIDAGVLTIVDLRSENELEVDPPPYGANTGPGSLPLYLNLPVLDYDDQDTMARLRRVRSMGEDYCVLIDGFRRGIGRILQAIADAPPGGVLVHCHAGKDRTGIVVALLLALVGVPDEVIVADYAASQEHLWPAWEAQQRAGMGGAVPPRAPPEAMVELLGCLEREYGGAAGYMRAAGLDEESIGRLRERLIG